MDDVQVSPACAFSAAEWRGDLCAVRYSYRPGARPVPAPAVPDPRPITEQRWRLTED